MAKQANFWKYAPMPKENLFWHMGTIAYIHKTTDVVEVVVVVIVVEDVESLVML